MPAHPGFRRSEKVLPQEICGPAKILKPPAPRATGAACPPSKTRTVPRVTAPSQQQIEGRGKDGTGGPYPVPAKPTTKQTKSFPAAHEGHEDDRFLREARFYQRLAGDRVRCTLCPRACLVGEGQRGHCGVRENRGGLLYTLVHSRLSAVHVDPVEKKPLFHYLPGTEAFSLGTAGCNVNCSFCQNWELAHVRPEQIPAEYVPPERVAALALQARCPTIAFTYNEPSVFAEYLMDTTEAAHKAGLRCVAISNGYLQPAALRELYGQMDAVKIDLKAFDEAFYRSLVSARLAPVLDSLVALRALGKWLEIVYLVIPTLNDDETKLRDLARWIKANLGTDVPLHFTQFHPSYRLRELPITPVETLERARKIALAEGLHYVYIGNVPGHPAQNTYCPGCRKLLVERTGFAAGAVQIGTGNLCPDCKTRIAGVWRI